MIVLLLAACGPTATLTIAGAGPFDDVRSVVWTLPQSTNVWVLADGALQDLGPAVLDGNIGFYAEPGMCADAADTLSALGTASVDLLGASANGTDAAALCESVPAWLDALARVDALRANGEVRLTLGYCVGDACSGPIAATEYPFGDTSSSQWTGTLTYTDPAFADGAYERAGLAWNVDACGFDADFLEAEGAAHDQWVAVDGAITFENAAAQHVVGSLAGDFDDTHGNTAAVSGSFTADVCEMPAVEALVYAS